jgi:hypothetical protein
MTASPRHTCNYQLAGYSFEYRDEMGAIDFPSFVEAFEAFPWGEQMRQREKMTGGCSATISVVDEEQDRVCWVSVMGNDLRPKFLLGLVYNKKQRRTASVKVPGVVRWCEIRIAPSRRSVPSMFRAFFAGDTRKLMTQFRAYKLYEQGEAMMPIPKP